MSLKKWPARPPQDLVMRLADVLSFRDIGPDDIWDEIGDWLDENGVEVTDLVLARLPLVQSVCSGRTDVKGYGTEGKAMQMTRLIYASTHGPLDAETVGNILLGSRANNVRDAITGALIIDDVFFVQILEGERAAIGRCMMRIMQDRRHRNIQVLSCSDAVHRLFLEWSMHRIETSRIKAEILARYKINGRFDPVAMTQFAVEDLCRTLAGGNWQAEAA